MQDSQSGAALHAPEGAWRLIDRRPAALNTFQPDYVTRVCIAAPQTDGARYLVSNAQSSLWIFREGNDRDALRRVDMRQQGQPGAQGSGTAAPHITALAYAPGCEDEYDLLVGMSNGEVKVLSLQAQLSPAAAATFKPAACICFNSEGILNSSRCVAVAWIPTCSSTGSACSTTFLVAHANGAVFLHQKVVGSSLDTGLLARTNSDAGLRPPPRMLCRPRQRGIAAAALSPSGDRVALAGRDGVLLVVDLESGAALGGFKSYYGGLQCCAWSPDGLYLAAGGEDDLLAVYGIEERAVVAHCEGHQSWVSGVAFDGQLWKGKDGEREQQQQQQPGLSRSTSGIPAAEATYRLVSVGQDCQVLFWDVSVADVGMVPMRLLPIALPRPPRAAGSGAGGASLRTDEAAIAPATPRAEMTIVAPTMQQRIYYEPLCDVLCTKDSLLTAAQDGSVHRWQRPPPLASAQADQPPVSPSQEDAVTKLPERGLD